MARLWMENRKGEEGTFTREQLCVKMTTGTSPSPPANFLSLPLEIRQQILSCSLMIPFQRGITYNQNLQEETHKLQKRGHDTEKLTISVPNINNWITTLSHVHESITQDLAFIQKKYLADSKETTLLYVQPHHR